MKLSDWMTAAGLDDDAVAARVATDRTTISRIRRGVTRPSWDLAAKFKAVSDGAVTADDFLSAEASP
jgi:transcriptional regulator with XRE-family HTH domain